MRQLCGTASVFTHWFMHRFTQCLERNDVSFYLWCLYIAFIKGIMTAEPLYFQPEIHWVPQLWWWAWWAPSWFTFKEINPGEWKQILDSQRTCCCTPTGKISCCIQVALAFSTYVFPDTIMKKTLTGSWKTSHLTSHPKPEVCKLNVSQSCLWIHPWAGHVLFFSWGCLVANQ